MSLLNPAALAFAAMAIPIIVFYVLRIRRRRQLVPTLMFWDQIFDEAAPRSLWRRLRYWLSLLAQLCLLALLVVALADPVSSRRSLQPRHWIVVVDQSASMQATDGEGTAVTRFDEARQVVRRVIRSMRANDEMTLIGAGPQPIIACGRTHHQPTLHEAIEQVEANETPADLAKCMRLAASVDKNSEGRKLLLVTDAPGVEQLNKNEITDKKLVLHQCGGRGSNVGITGFAVRPRADNPLELQGMLRLANYGDEKVSAEVRLSLNGELVDMIVHELDAGEEALRDFPLMHEGDGILEASLRIEDDLAVDNKAYAALPEAQHKKVLLVSEGNLFLQSVIGAHPWMHVERITVQEITSKQMNECDVVVYDRHVPASLPDKPCLFVHPAEGNKLWEIEGDLQNPLVSDLNKDSPLLAHVNLQNVTFHRARQVVLNKKAAEAINSFEHPLLASWASASPSMVLLAVDINQSDLPWRTAFPILMQNILNYLAGQSDDPVSAYRTGRNASLGLHAPEQVTAADSAGQAVSVVKNENRIDLGPVFRSGLLTLRMPDRDKKLAFNLACAEESCIRGKNKTESSPGKSSDIDELLQASAFCAWPWWIILAVIVLVLSTVEWCLYQRRWID
jgi:hypothetical protein